MDRELLTTKSELGSNALGSLAVRLRGFTNVVLPRACEGLKRVLIWLGMDDGRAPRPRCAGGQRTLNSARGRFDASAKRAENRRR